MKSFLPDCRSSFQQKLLALLFVLASIVILKPSILWLSNTHYLGGIYGDGGIYVWLSQIFPNSINPSNWFETNSFYPYSKTLAFSDNWILPSLVIKFLTLLGASHPLSYNLTFIFSLVLAGFITYLLLFNLTGSFLISVLASLIAPHIASFQNHLGHPQLQHYWIIPLTLLLFLKWISSKNALLLLLLGLSLCISFLCSIYLTIFSAYIFGAAFLIFILLRPRYFHPREVTKSLVCFSLGLVPIIPFLIPYGQLKDAFGSRFYYEAHAFQATAKSYISLGNFSWGYPYLTFSHSEAHLGTGLTLLALLFFAIIKVINFKSSKKLYFSIIAGLIVFLLTTELSAATFSDLWGLTTLSGWLLFVSLILLAINFSKQTANKKISFFTNQEILFLLFGLSVFFLILSFGPVNNPVVHSYSPFYVLYKLLPGLDGIRAVSRFGLVVNFLFLIIGFFTLALLHAKQTISTAMVFLISILILAENFTIRYPFEAPPSSFSAFKELSQLNPLAQVSITLPYGGKLNTNQDIESYFDFAKRQILSSLWFLESTPSTKTINGFSGVKTKLVSELPQELFDFPSENSIRVLSTFTGLDTVVILPEFFSHGNSKYTDVEQFISEVNKFSDKLSVFYKGDDQSFLIKLTPKIDLSSTIDLKTTSLVKGISCKISFHKAKEDCVSQSLSVTQIPGNRQIPYSIELNPDNNKLVILMPKAIKAVPANTIRISNQFTDRCLVTFEGCINR